MANSVFWLNYAVLTYTKALLDDLVTAGILDEVTLDPENSEFKAAGKVAYLFPRGDVARLNGDFPPHVTFTGSIGIAVWAGKSLTQETILAQEALLASIRDKIVNDGINSGGYFALDPPAQVEELSELEEPIVSRERDIAGAVLKLEYKNHDSRNG